MNARARNLHATIKLHKSNIYIRPTFNWKNPSTYDLAKQLAKMLHNLLYTYDVRNSNHLMTNIQITELKRDMRICSFDIGNMYTNMRERDTINIINNILERNPEINMNFRKEIIHILQTVMKQNYFQFDQ
jgi:uncharacterized membrane protein